MTVRERINVAANEMERIGHDWAVGFPYETTEAIIRAAFPELFTDPPAAWIAPWEATNEMHFAGTANDKMILHTVGGVYAAMRDSHLKETPKRG